MKYIVTGCAGFIGMHVAEKILKKGDTVLGVDNINNYYSQKLKLKRLEILKKYKKFYFLKLDITQKRIVNIFKKFKPNKVIHLAAFAGVRHSIKKPYDYLETNIHGFLNILEGCKVSKCDHLIYASSSSVYGSNKTKIFSEDQQCISPLSLYGASKLANEHMAHSYSHIYKFKTTGLRFFTVYGPWGRPDMALYIFAEAIKKNKPLPLFNYGKMKRDFTYIDDIADGILKIVYKNKVAKMSSIYNIGRGQEVKLMDFIKEIEKNIGQKAIIKKLPMQIGDIQASNAKIDKINRDYNFKPKVTYKQGIKKFIEWFQGYSK